MNRLQTVLLWAGVLAGVAGIILGIRGSIFFIIFWMLGMGAWHHYRQRKR